MSWKLKAHTLAVLSRMPAGRFLYHRLQQVAGTNRLQLRRDLDRAFELVDLVHQAGDSIEGKICLEVGTGWRPLVPFVFALGGAKGIITVDVNPWLTLPYAIETWLALEDQLPEIAAVCRLPEHDVYDRYHSIPINVRALDQLLMPLQIQYVYPGDARQTGLPDSSVDLVLSSNVLEHIPRDIQTDIHRESLRVLRTGGLSVHRFNPQDHYATVDDAITHANFLQFSSDEWNWYGGSGLAYHNRLRSRDYREMFAEAGFDLEICRERVDKRSLDAMADGHLVVHPEFEKYTPEELAVDYMWVVGRKPVAANVEESSRSPQHQLC
ncbi:methyltransferase domain-containing protein [Planctomicrobium piriforme]|uniref:Methyltransferase domain-containing protein n=1 Tax=Planctomicrobium piriforme TaxID=1576369 RepID=A0A1I3GUX5_9PLAN|nr:class I SAM-dependent methyltransferase [Planctomicrobium piriforme]SFI27234.1 Methyltransferase domain-containing protein [Planctomicrobium piriforme]